MRMISVPRRRLFCKNVTSQRDKLLQESHPAQESATILTQPGKKAQANWYNVDYPEEQCEARKGERRWKPQVIKSCVGKEGEKVEARCRDAKPRHQQRAAEVSGTKSQIHGSKVMKRHNVDAEMLSGNRRTLRKLRQNSIADGSPNMPSSCYRRAATSTTSTGADAINGRSTTTKVTTTRSTSRPTHKGNLEIRTSLESSTINNLYAVMDEQSPDAAARRRSLQIAKQTTTTKDFQEPSHNTNATATSASLSTSADVHWIVKM
ncbi:hypothetical protein B9Z55_002369 [Caenorhabditis nigoni]|uniref:Uncharacterized protein n=1 Tax=Caenorhabditis nigoni TaxID=1611254 RepID=A0A2G5VJZ8_9PELO|nr:hypothetical protein B9Z55_002369 [Caenorhabditis nigoni]